MRTVSVREVAEMAGVSVGTVSNVLNKPEMVSAKTSAKVRAAVETLGYVRNDAARQLRMGRSRSVGLIVRDVSNPFFTDVARGAEAAAAENDLVVLLANSDESAQREASYLDLFEEQRVLGILTNPIEAQLSKLARLRDRGTAVVLVDREAPAKLFSSVAVDDVAGGYMAVEHLAQLGRKRIMFVGGPVAIPQVADRLAGARHAAAERGNVSLQTMLTPSLTVMSGRAAGESIYGLPRSERPDAVFAANDLVALGLLQSFGIHDRLKVPEDIALIGYDDIDFASSAVVPLSSVSQPSELLGRTALELLLRETDLGVEGREHIVFQPELIQRESTRGS
jgi:LacI family transcriptional regulator